MKPIKKILVGLDLSEIDLTLLKFASFITQSTKTREIIFLNNIKNLTIPEEVKKEFPDILNRAVNERKGQLKSEVENILRVDEDVKIRYKVTSGNMLTNYLKMIDTYDVDLVLVGRKDGKVSSGIITQRLARRIDVSLMIAPQGSERILEDKKKVKHILVPVDFSNHSLLAIDQAIDIAVNARTNRTINVIGQHVYSVPVGYHYTGKSFDEFAKVMEAHAKKQWERFISKVDLRCIDVQPVYTLDKNDKLVDCILTYANEQEVDGIIIGARGITPASSFFIGSSAEKMLKLDTNIPFLVVRKKGDKKGIIEFLKKI